MGIFRVAGCGVVVQDVGVWVSIIGLFEGSSVVHAVLMYFIELTLFV